MSRSSVRFRQVAPLSTGGLNCGFALAQDPIQRLGVDLCPQPCPHGVLTLDRMASTDTPGRARAARGDLEGIRQRGGRYQVRVFAGWDPVIGKRIDLTGSAKTEREAVKPRDKLRVASRGDKRHGSAHECHAFSPA
jgi:hypothetical protein